MYIKIAQPCPEDWDNMRPENGSRFCTSCQKSVFDFTDKRPIDMLEKIAGTAGSICARAYPAQLNLTRQQLEDVIDTITREARPRANAFKILLLCSALLTGCDDGRPPAGSSGPADETVEDMLTGVVLERPAHIPDTSGEFEDTELLPALGQVPPPPPPGGIIVVKEDEGELTGDITYVSHSQPEFPGGQAALLEWLSDSISDVHFKASDFPNGLVGTTVVRFVIDENGRIADPVMIRNITHSPKFEAYILDRLMEMPTWTPGFEDGEPVATHYTLPIRINWE